MLYYAPCFSDIGLCWLSKGITCNGTEQNKRKGCEKINYRNLRKMKENLFSSTKGSH